MALCSKKKVKGMAIQCVFNHLLNRERHLVSSENKKWFAKLHLIITTYTLLLWKIGNDWDFSWHSYQKTFRHVAHVTFMLSLSVGGCAVKLAITGKVLLIAFTGLCPEQRGLLVHYIRSMIVTSRCWILYSEIQTNFMLFSVSCQHCNSV